MDEKTEAMIRGLADKLDTTVGHLWGVLITQATITGLTNVFLVAAWIALLVVTFRFLRRKTITPPATREDPYPEPDWTDVDAFIPWMGWVGALLIAMLYVSTSLPLTIAALFNPEYWALRHILG